MKVRRRFLRESRLMIGRCVSRCRLGLLCTVMMRIVWRRSWMGFGFTLCLILFTIRIRLIVVLISRLILLVLIMVVTLSGRRWWLWCRWVGVRCRMLSRLSRLSRGRMVNCLRRLSVWVCPLFRVMRRNRWGVMRCGLIRRCVRMMCYRTLILIRPRNSLRITWLGTLSTLVFGFTWLRVAWLIRVRILWMWFRWGWIRWGRITWLNRYRCVRLLNGFVRLRLLFVCMSCIVLCLILTIRCWIRMCRGIVVMRIVCRDPLRTAISS